MASPKPDSELSEAAFHAKYGFITGWDDVRAMVWAMMQNHWGNDQVLSVLRELYERMDAERDSKRDDYVRRIDV